MTRGSRLAFTFGRLSRARWRGLPCAIEARSPQSDGDAVVRKGVLRLCAPLRGGESPLDRKIVVLQTRRVIPAEHVSADSRAHVDPAVALDDLGATQRPDLGQANIRGVETRHLFVSSCGPTTIRPVGGSYQAWCHGQTRQPSSSICPFPRSARRCRQRRETAKRSPSTLSAAQSPIPRTDPGPSSSTVPTSSSGIR